MGSRASTRKELICLQKSNLRIYVLSNSGAAASDNRIETPERDPTELYPYAAAGGEVVYYRLELRLNDLGHAFLKVSNHLSDAE